jgi:hypothetical protein
VITRRQLREWIIRTSPWPPLRWLYAAAYGVALAWLVIRLRRVREIRSLDLRLPTSSHCFGSSDLDLRAEGVPLRVPEFFALAERLADVLLPPEPNWRRIFDFYLFPAGEYELHGRLRPPATRSDRRWIRLIGRHPLPEAPSREPQEACLGRALCECSWIGLYLFETELDLHRTRILYSRVLRVDAELRGRRGDRGQVRPDLIRAVLDTAEQQALRGRVRRTSFDALARAHALALAETTELARSLVEQEEVAHSSDVALTVPAVTPDTLDAAVRACRQPIVDLCESAAGVIRGAILGATPGSRYEYRIYLLVRDDLDVEQHVALCRSLRELFVLDNSTISAAFFRLRHPVVLTRTLWGVLGRCYNPLRSVEEHYFLTRHGVVLWGEDARGELQAPGRAAVLRSAAISVADLRNRIWGSLHDRQAAQLADLIAGRIPTLWLLLSRGCVATSPAEAVAACREHGFPHAAALVDLHQRLAGRHPRELAAVDHVTWRPALDALADWLDDLVGRALAIVRGAQP